MDQLAAAVKEGWNSVEGIITGLGADDWGRPTPCTGWNVVDVLAHLAHLEGWLVHGYHQPDPPSDWPVSDSEPLHQATGLGVASRRSWSPEEVIEEARRAFADTISLLGTPDLDWDEMAMSPIGPISRKAATELRVTDLMLHLTDLRAALGLAFDTAEPETLNVAVRRAVRLTPWAWVKRAGAGEGDHLLLDLSGPGGVTNDVVVEQGKAVIRARSSTDGDPENSIGGTGLAYLVAASGRHALVSAAGGLVVHGQLARRLLEEFRIVG
jgi:uncharacterized protein (TIGR03083 family)